MAAKDNYLICFCEFDELTSCILIECGHKFCYSCVFEIISKSDSITCEVLKYLMDMRVVTQMEMFEHTSAKTVTKNVIYIYLDIFSKFNEILIYDIKGIIKEFRCNFHKMFDVYINLYEKLRELEDLNKRKSKCNQLLEVKKEMIDILFKGNITFNDNSRFINIDSEGLSLENIKDIEKFAFKFTSMQVKENCRMFLKL